MSPGKEKPPPGGGARVRPRYRNFADEDPDDVLRRYWSPGQAEEAATRRVTRGPKRQRGKGRPEYPTQDRKTVRPTLSRAENGRLDEMLETANELRQRLIYINEEHHVAHGHFLSGNELSALLPGLKKEAPALRELPAEAAQAIAQEVCRAFIHLLKSQWDEGSLRLPVRSIRVAHPAFAGGHVRLPKLGWRPYPAKGALRAVLESDAVHVLGGFLWRSPDSGNWCLTVSFRRLSQARISRAVVNRYAAAEYQDASLGPDEETRSAPRAVAREEAAQHDDLRICKSVVRWAENQWSDFGKPWGDYAGRVMLAELRIFLAQAGQPASNRRLIGAIRRAVGRDPRRMWVGRNARYYGAADLLRIWLHIREGISYEEWLAGLETAALADSGGGYAEARGTEFIGARSRRPKGAGGGGFCSAGTIL